MVGLSLVKHEIYFETINGIVGKISEPTAIFIVERVSTCSQFPFSFIFNLIGRLDQSADPEKYFNSQRCAPPPGFVVSLPKLLLQCRKCHDL